MKITVLLLLCLALCGCDRKKFPDRVRGVDTYDGCEYVVFQTSAGDYTWTHKGNCTNVIHAIPVVASDWRYLGQRYGSPIPFPVEPLQYRFDGQTFLYFPKGYIENPELAPRSQTIQRDIPSIIPEPIKPKRKEK